jgi:hypothetical protein
MRDEPGFEAGFSVGTDGPGRLRQRWRGEERRFLFGYERELSYEEGRFLLSGEL